MSEPVNISQPAKVDHTSNFPTLTSADPGEKFEVRQTSDTADWKPNPVKSLELDGPRQALIDDIIALYSCQPTVQRIERYAPDGVYDNQFVYANDRYKIAGQWFALPNLLSSSKNDGYEIVKNDRDLIQFKNEQIRTLKVVPRTITVNALVSLSLDPDSIDTDFIKVKYHKDQADEKDYSHEGWGFTFKKWQADNVMKYMSREEVAHFKKDEGAGENKVRTYGDGTSDAQRKDL